MIKAILTALLVSLVSAFLAMVATFAWFAWRHDVAEGGSASIYIGVLLPPAVTAAVVGFCIHDVVSATAAGEIVVPHMLAGEWSPQMVHHVLSL